MNEKYRDLLAVFKFAHIPLYWVDSSIPELPFALKLGLFHIGAKKHLRFLNGGAVHWSKMQFQPGFPHCLYINLCPINGIFL